MAFSLAGGYLDDPDSNVVFYILLKAVDRFYTQYHRYPGTEIISGIYQCGLLNLLAQHRGHIGAALVSGQLDNNIDLKQTTTATATTT